MEKETPSMADLLLVRLQCDAAIEALDTVLQLMDIARSDDPDFVPDGIRYIRKRLTEQCQDLDRQLIAAGQMEENKGKEV